MPTVSPYTTLTSPDMTFVCEEDVSFVCELLRTAHREFLLKEITEERVRELEDSLKRIITSYTSVPYNTYVYLAPQEGCTSVCVNITIHLCDIFQEPNRMYTVQYVI